MLYVKNKIGFPVEVIVASSQEDKRSVTFCSVIPLGSVITPSVKKRMAELHGT